MLISNILNKHLLSYSKGAALPFHDKIVDIPFSTTGTKTMEPDFILGIDVHPEAILGITVERTEGLVPVLVRKLERYAKQVLNKIDNLIDVGY